MAYTYLPKKVQNKNPASIQISAEQILHEARDQHDAAEIRLPNNKITDSTELNDYRIHKRKEFEDQIRCDRLNKSVWVKYARWEESQKDLDRARSVWERALEVDYRDHTLWLKYAEFEMNNNKIIYHARNVFDRAVTYLPRVDQLWYKYIHMEEIIGNVAAARHVFDKWMQWQPDQHGWLSYIKFESRYNEVERARVIFERFVDCHPTIDAWIRFAKFEIKHGEIALARNCYNTAVEKFADEEDADVLFLAFAEFEEKNMDFQRARCIYKSAIDHIPEVRAEELYKKFVSFESQYGDKEGIEDVIVGKRRLRYEEEVTKNPFNYDAWFDYIRLEESVGDTQRIREVYERAIANVPLAQDKRYWTRYINLWINYALYEELEAEDIERAKQVYKLCRELIPHKKFSFSKIWLLSAQLEIRLLNLKGARAILGEAIGRAPKAKIFNKYIEIELQLGNIDRCRKLYEKYLQWSPENCYAWIKYAELEKSLAEASRARALFELAIEQPLLDMPQLLWKAYIDFEISEGELCKARDLYENLLNRTKHVKVWIRYAQFEAFVIEESNNDDDDDDPEQMKIRLERARGIFERGETYFITQASDMNEERLILLQEWLNLESSFGEVGDVELVHAKWPHNKVKRKRQTTNLRIMEAAYHWKKIKKISPASQQAT